MSLLFFFEKVLTNDENCDIVNTAQKEKVVIHLIIKEHILLFRGEKNITQKQAAELFGVSKMTIYRAEKGMSINSAKAAKILKIIESEVS